MLFIDNLILYFLTDRRVLQLSHNPFRKHCELDDESWNWRRCLLIFTYFVVLWILGLSHFFMSFKAYNIYMLIIQALTV